MHDLDILVMAWEYQRQHGPPNHAHTNLWLLPKFAITSKFDMFPSSIASITSDPVVERAMMLVVMEDRAIYDPHPRVKGISAAS